MNETEKTAYLPCEQQNIRSRCFHPAGGFIEFAEKEIEHSILHRFDEIVRTCPDRLALKTRRSEFTYADLNKAANRVAHALLALDDAKEGPVGLLFENSAAFVVASLGVLKAGRIQVALESTFPETRLDYLLKQSQASVLLTDNANLALAQRLRPAGLLNVDQIDERFSAANPALDLDPDAVVTIDYTSGSTGPPKGMIWNQRGILQVVARHTNTSHICMHDRLVMFRASVRAYLSVLLNGAAFYPVDLRREDATDLANWLANQQITLYRAAVSTFRSLVNVLTSADKFPALRLILLFGEQVYRSDVEMYRKHFPDRCLFGTSLGCNEMDDYAYFFVDKDLSLDRGVLPGGYPTSDIDVLLLDDNGKHVGNEEGGEICVRSRYRPLGYWRQPEQTRAAFVNDPDGKNAPVYRTGDVGRMDGDGCLFHLGRKDFQIKIRGYRVDISAVEAALREIAGVKEAVVVSREDPAGDRQLIAYITSAGDRPPTVGELRHYLLRELPEYMVPSAFIPVESFPLTATGKVDRRALPAPDGMRPVLESPFVAPRTPVEEGLAAIWAEILGLREVGVLDNFLELGGDSLRATRVIARVMSRFQVRAPVRALLEAPTVAEMAMVILQDQAATVEETQLDRLLLELDSLSEEEAQSLLNERGR